MTDKQPQKKAASKKPPLTQKKDLYDEKIKPFLKDIAALRAKGVTEGEICKQYGVGRTAWAEYKKKHPELNETLYRAREVDKKTLEDRAHKIALGYDYTETTTVEYYEMKDGEKIITGGKTTTVKKHAKADSGMMQFLLINRFPGDYARDPQVLEIRKELLELKKKLADAGGGEEV